MQINNRTDWQLFKRKVVDEIMDVLQKYPEAHPLLAPRSEWDRPDEPKFCTHDYGDSICNCGPDPDVMITNIVVAVQSRHLTHNDEYVLALSNPELAPSAAVGLLESAIDSLGG